MTLKDRRVSILFFLPAAVFMSLFFIYPMFLLAANSFLSNKDTSEWVGFHNYIHVLTSKSFHQTLLNTVNYVLGAVTLELAIGMMIALMLSTGFKGSNVIRTLMLTPLMISPLVCGLVWKFMLNDQFGILNVFLYKVGLIDTPQGILWLSDSRYALISVMMADIWLTTPFMMLVLLAGINGIPQRLYEAAQLDGANKFQRFWHITLPSIKSVMVVAVVLRMIDAARTFDIIWVMTQGGPNNSTALVSTAIYKSLARYNQEGYASAMAIIFMILLLGICSVFLKYFWNPGKKAS
jgi:multiple sugar transport system permease protein